MTTSNLLLAFGLVAFYLVTIAIGVWLTLSYTRASRRLTDHVARFNRDEDVDDAADMATDSEQ